MNVTHRTQGSIPVAKRLLGSSVLHLVARSWLRVAGAVGSVLAVVVVLLATASPSSAHYWQNYGRPGTVQLKTVEGYAGWFGSTIRVPGRYVYRSPATTGRQHVVLMANIYSYSRYTNRWTPEQSLYRAATIPAGVSRVWVPAIDFEPYGANDYTVDITVGWRSVATGRVLGNTWIDERHVRDYACMVRTLECRDGRLIGGRGAIWIF